MTVYHYTKKGLLDSNDPVKVVLVGVGGSGSQVLTGLGQINHAICELGHPTGIHVTAFDPDTVSESNVGRQLFSPADVGESKARVLVERLNRFYGLNWRSIPRYFSADTLKAVSNPDIIITCVDTVKARREVISAVVGGDFHRGSYWLDMGNAEDTGQVILGTTKPIDQPEGGCDFLPSVFDFFPNMEDSETENRPSCSMAEALESQDLFINRTVANFGLDLIWRLFRYGRLEHHGCFADLKNYTVRPVSVEQSQKTFNEVKKAA